MKGKALILFFKYPEKGTVKTRIAKDLCDDFTLELYNYFIADLVKTSDKIDCDIFIVYSVTNEENDKNCLWQKEYRCLLQKGADLGIRMFNAFQDVSSEGYGKLLLIGSDTPDLPAAYINEAFLKLNIYDLVLGPSADGGYYLIAMHDDTLDRAIFDGMPWSTPLVLNETLKVAGSRNIACHLLPEWHDIDEVNDLRHFYDRNKQNHGTSYTMEFLSRNEVVWYKKT